jgi:hypothetical protein
LGALIGPTSENHMMLVLGWIILAAVAKNRFGAEVWVVYNTWKNWGESGKGHPAMQPRHTLMKSTSL